MSIAVGEAYGGATHARTTLKGLNIVRFCSRKYMTITCFWLVHGTFSIPWASSGLFKLKAPNLANLPTIALFSTQAMNRIGK